MADETTETTDTSSTTTTDADTTTVDTTTETTTDTSTKTDDSSTDTDTTENAHLDKTKMHDESVVYETADGETKNTVYRPVDENGIPIPIATKNYGREEHHFVFGDAVFKEE